jgi:DNA-directed RNA polymerase specialized sigma24 family protein
MTPTRLRECLALLRWSQRGLADQLQRPEGTVRQWARGAVQIPDDVAAWLERIAPRAGRLHDRLEALHRENPAPDRDLPLA